MSKRFKGFSSEDFFSTIFVSILIMVFVFGVIKSYNSYLEKIAIEEQQIYANAIAKKIFFENSGLIDNITQKFNLPDRGIKILLRDTESNINYTSGNETFFLNAESVFSSAVPILLLNKSTGKYSPGILEVYIGK